MKSLKTVRQVGVRQSLLLAGLVLASAGGQAAVLPKITVTGVVGNSVTTQDVALQYDPSPWFGKAYTLEMTVDAEGVVGDQITDPIVTGLVLNHWLPNRVNYRLTIDGTLVASGSDTQWADIETINNFTVPAGITDLPTGVQVGHTYDSYYLSMDGGVQFGCLDGMCDSPADTHEFLRMTFQYFWDMDQGDAITGNGMPNLLGGAPAFT